MMGTPPHRRDLRRFIHVKPVLDCGSLEPGAAAADAIRTAVRAHGLVPENSVTVRLTGPVSLADEEFSTLADGVVLNTALTGSAVLLILWLALRSGRIIAAIVANLFVGLAVTAAAGLAMVGSLNLISVAFAMLFVGIGVDFGIQFAVQLPPGAVSKRRPATGARLGCHRGRQALGAGRRRHRSGVLGLPADRLKGRVRARAHCRSWHDHRLCH
jgi:hypothetical protein